MFAVQLAKAMGIAVMEIGHPYWIEVLPRRLWSRGCVEVRSIPPNFRSLDLNDPVSDWKECDDCGHQLRDPYNWDSQEGWQNYDRSHRLRCSRCKAENGHAYSEQKEVENSTPDADLEPARCCCGFFLPDCVVAKLPPCPAWDVPGDRSIRSDNYYVPPAMWTFSFPLPPKREPVLKSAARWQGKKKRRTKIQGDLFGSHPDA